MTVYVDALDGDLAPQQPITWNNFDANALRFNQVGAFTLTMPGTDRNWQLVSFDDDGEFLPVPLLTDWQGIVQVPLLAEQYQHDKTIDAQSGAVTETITFSGADMLCLLANRLVYRDATKTWVEQTVGTTKVTDNAETVIKTLVAANMVTAGDTDRRVPHFTVATDLGRGATVTYSIVIAAASTGEEDAVMPTSGQSLMDMVRAVAAQANIGVKIDLIDGELVFDTYLPRDLTATAVFSYGLGNLRGDSLSDAVPTANAVLMQSGATSGAFTETAGSGATDPWRRVEIYNDQTSTTDADQVTQAQADAIAAGAGPVQLSMTATDIPVLTYGVDYGLGDKVTAEIRGGVAYADIIGAVQLTADATAEPPTETVTPTIGAVTDATADDPTATAALAAAIRRLEKQLRSR